MLVCMYMCVYILCVWGRGEGGLLLKARVFFNGYISYFSFRVRGCELQRENGTEKSALVSLVLLSLLYTT